MTGGYGRDAHQGRAVVPDASKRTPNGTSKTVADRACASNSSLMLTLPCESGAAEARAARREAEKMVDFMFARFQEMFRVEGMGKKWKTD